MYLVCMFLISCPGAEYVGRKKNELVVERDVEVRLPGGHRWFVI